MEAVHRRRGAAAPRLIRILPLLLTLLGGCGGSEEPETAAPAPAFWFVDIAVQAGVTAPTWCGRPEKPHLLESNGTGLALVDVDADGVLDLYLVNGWRLEGAEVVERGRNVLYRGRGDGTFEDVTARAGIGDDGWGSGIAAGDGDGDGDVDLFVTNFGPDVLYLNRGDGTFDRAPDPPGIDGWSAGAALFDADRDGDLDLFVAGYVECTLEEVLHAEPTLDWEGMKVMLGPFGLEGEANRYFVNEGGGHFREATEESGLVDVGLFYSFAVAAIDFDADLDLDLYVANDSNPNYLYRNDGQGHFQEIGLWSGAALSADGAAQAGMGIATGDVDLDGRVDLFVTNFAHDTSTLYVNEGGCLFTDATLDSNLRAATYLPLSWGATLGDFDHDGRLDLFVANGHIYPQAERVPDAAGGYGQRNLLFHGEDGRFTEVGAGSGPGLAVQLSSRGVAAGDIDSDGDLDLVVSNVDAPPTLLRNDTVPRGAWLAVDAPGALRVEVRLGGTRLVRHAVHGGSFLSVSDARFHFGLGPVEEIDELVVVWSDGERTRQAAVGVNQLVRVTRR
ncbi:MAG: CRTAC1 family protein [Planctomycetota bacterium]